MALPAWPDGIPYDPLTDGFSPIDRVLPPIATDMEGGNQRQRPRPGDNVGTIGQTIIMTYDQFNVFTPWWKTTLNNGTARFTAPVWTGTQFETKVCQFAPDGKPKDSEFSPDLRAVTMKLRVYDT
jgi:hypothetical protein